MGKSETTLFDDSEKTTFKKEKVSTLISLFCFGFFFFFWGGGGGTTGVFVPLASFRFRSRTGSEPIIISACLKNGNATHWLRTVSFLVSLSNIGYLKAPFFQLHHHKLIVL